MCGILGKIGLFDEMEFRQNLTKLSHRGPDGTGVWKANDCILGHTRLSIIDQSEAGNQPMLVFDRFVITFNGEIFNYIEIRKELELKGYRFESNSDTEVLLYAYVEWKELCLAKFNGMWSFAIWDKVEKTLFLSRDRVGEKPLFYLKSENGLAFASEMKPLYNYCKELKINLKTIQEAKRNVFSYESKEDCLVEEIKRFPAGSYGIYKDGKLEIRKYWEPLKYVHHSSLCYDDQVELFRELFLDACRIRMRSDVPLGTALSGGLDSSATICSMSHLFNGEKNTGIQQNWQHAFVACFRGSFLDERPYAEKVTNYLGIDATFLEIDPLKDINNLEYYLYQFEELYLTSPIPFIQIYREVRNQGVRVTLDGHGADELFGGYPFSLQPAFIDSVLNPARYSEVKRTIEESTGTKIGREESIQNLKYALVNRFQKFYPMDKTNLNLSLKHEGLDYLNSALFELTYTSILPTLLRNYDRYSMINGVEVRMPFLDYRLLEFAFNIPYSSKVRNGFTKNIVRDAMKDIMPKEIAYRKNKVGFNSPGAEWIQGPLKEWFKDTVNSKYISECTLLTELEIKELKAVNFNSHVSFNEGEKIWSKILLALWVKSFRYAN